MTLKRQGSAYQTQTVDVEKDKVAYVEWDSNFSRSAPVLAELPSGSMLVRFFHEQGFKGMCLKEEQLGDSSGLNTGHLLVSAAINQKPTELMLDSGSANTGLSRQNLNKFGAIEQKTSHPARGALGLASSEFFGTTKLESLTLFYLLKNSRDVGTITMWNVPALVSNIPRVDGILGLDEMRKIGAVLDCKEKILFVAPYGPLKRVSDDLARILSDGGYIRIPTELNSQRQFNVNGSLNGVPCTIVIDTGSMVTCVDKSLGRRAAIAMKASSAAMTREGGLTGDVSAGRINNMSIWSFKTTDAETVFVDFKSSQRERPVLLGMSQLRTNSAIIDTGAGVLYLK